MWKVTSTFKLFGREEGNSISLFDLKFFDENFTHNAHVTEVVFLLLTSEYNNAELS